MKQCTWFVMAGLLAFGCGVSTSDDDDDAGGEGEGEGEGEECSDLDGDGFGVGATCEGDDCDEGNPDRHEGCGADCDANPFDVGCTCDEAQPMPCFDGNPDAANQRPCRAGIKRCEAGKWSFCDGQTLPGPEICDTVDNDCDGTVDEDVLNACGTCGDSNCNLAEIGAEDWDVENEGNGVIVDDGDLTLSEYASLTAYLWVASQTDSTVTLMNTQTRDQLARYLVTDQEGLDQPMSISILPWAGAVMAVGRTEFGGGELGEYGVGNHITRIAYAPCPDTDNDGVVRTSAGYDDLLEYGSDDCVLWTQEYPFSLRVVAWETREVLDGREDYIWAGDLNVQRIVEIDADGEETGRDVPLNIPPAGLVVTPQGQIAVAAEWPTSGMAVVDPVNLDKVEYATNDGEKLCSIATDVEGNIWIPNDLGSQVWVAATEDVIEIPECHGAVAATENGAYFGGWCEHSIYHRRLIEGDGDRMAVEFGGDFPLPGGNRFPYPAVSVLEDLFVLDAGSNAVYLMDQETGEIEVVADNIPSPGICGDPTGVANQRSVGAAGTYKHLFEGCPDGEGPTVFSHITYDAELPAGTGLTFAVRVANSTEALAQAPVIAIGSAPGDASPLSIAAANGGTAPEGNILELSVTLTPSQIEAPRLRSVALGYACAEIID